MTETSSDESQQGGGPAPHSAPVNDVNICIATENGSGSASANSILFKSIFKMGIPCSGKNLFPSNIQGLPTWYQIRASGQGFLGRKDVIDVMVPFNMKTAAQDLQQVRPGGLVLYDNTTPLPDALMREDIHYVGVPAAQLVNEHIKVTQLRSKQRNMVYVGAIAALFGIPLETIGEVLNDTFGDKPAVIESNMLCIELGARAIAESGVTQQISRLEAIPGGNSNAIMTDGNTAAALGAIWGGASVVAWYPITPSSSLVESFQAYIGNYRENEDGTRRYAIVQAEDELASAAMLIGAGFCGARAMTSTSGPGLSLMQEGIGLAYFAEVPCVFFIVQRGGPSTGLPTRTQQADITLMHQGSHGDTRHIVLIPHDNHSIFEMSWRAFDYAERYQCPVFVMLDLDLGMNLNISAPFDFPDGPMDRGKVLTREELEAQGGVFQRYLDRDGDGIPQRTLPGTDHPGAAYFARGSGHNVDASYTEDNKVYKALLDRLRHKYETVREVAPAPIVETSGENGTGATRGVISFGSSVEPVREAIARLAATGQAMDHLVIRALPLSEKVREFVAGHEEIYLMEQNRDGQMAQIMRDEMPQLAGRIKSVLVYDGLPATAGEIIQLIQDLQS